MLEKVGNMILNIVLIQLDSTKDVTVQVPISDNQRLLQEKEFFLNYGFEVYADDLIEEGVEVWGLKKRENG